MPDVPFTVPLGFVPGNDYGVSPFHNLSQMEMVSSHTFPVHPPLQIHQPFTTLPQIQYSSAPQDKNTRIPTILPYPQNYIILPTQMHPRHEFHSSYNSHV